MSRSGSATGAKDGFEFGSIWLYLGSNWVRIGFNLALNGFGLGSFSVKKTDTFAVGLARKIFVANDF